MTRSAAAVLAVLLTLTAAHIGEAQAVDSADAARLGAQADTAYARAGAFFDQGRSDSAVASLRTAVTLYGRARRPEDQAYAQLDLGQILDRVGDGRGAMTAYWHAYRYFARVRADEPAARATLLIGESYQGRQRIADSAVKYYRHGLSLAERAGVPELVGQALQDIAVALDALGRPDSALAYYRRALAAVAGTDTSAVRERVYNNLGRLYEGLGRFDSASAHYHQSLALRRLAGDRASEAMPLNNIGHTLLLAGSPDSALVYLRAALETPGAPARALQLARTNQARAFLAKGMGDSALAIARPALIASRGTNDAQSESWALDDLAAALAATGQPDSAEHYLREALRSHRSSGDLARQGRTLFELARLHRAADRDGSHRIAVALFDSAARIRGRVRARAGTDVNRAAFVEQDIDLFDTWALAQADPGAGPGKEVVALEALAVTERGRAQAMLDMLGSVGSSSRRPTAIAEGRRLLGVLARSRSAGLAYLATKDTLLIWTLAARRPVTLYRIPVSRDSVAALVRGVRGLVSSDSGPATIVARGVDADEALALDGPAARALSAILLPDDVQGDLRSAAEVVVVATGPLGLVPFAALPVDTVGTPFGGGVAVRYAPSLAILAETEARKTRRRATHPVRARGSLVVGNPSLVGVAEGLAPLPEAEAEARAVAADLGTKPLVGAMATEAAVRRRLATAPIVHLATHGIAYPTEAGSRLSFVALARGNGQDGRLTVGELLDDRENLTAELVVLSACESGVGDLRYAEGTIGLQRALLTRGASSVLVSLWSVPDESTRVLMERFYRHWRHDLPRPSKAEALRRAQADVRRIEGFEHPRYWAAFQLVGAH